MRLSALIYFYRRRLRTRPVQELLAGSGIAVGVALVLAVQVANSSIAGSSSQIVHSLIGPATLQIRSRDQNGFQESLLARVRKLPGVGLAAPLLDQTATLVGPSGRRVAIEVAGVNLGLVTLDGLGHGFPLGSLSADSGAILPSATASSLGIAKPYPGQKPAALPTVSLLIRGRASRLKVQAVLGPETIGALSSARSAIVPLADLQRIAGLSGRVTRILAIPTAGRQRQVRNELQTLTAGRLTVSDADQDVSLLSQALAPNSQATGFFAAVSALVGLLLAFNAMLLTAPERRRTIAELRIQGAKRWALVQMLLFQALCLGVTASLIGIAIGDVLSREVFHEVPGYLAAAFPLGTQTIIGLGPLLLAFLGGVLATCLATAPPLLDLRRDRAVDAIHYEDGEPGQALQRRTQWWLFLAGVTLIVVASVVWIAVPSRALAATVCLALGTVAVTPMIFAGILRLAGSLAARWRSLNMLLVAVRSLRATTVRSLALAVTGAMAVFGAVAVQGAHHDLLRGLYGDYSQYVGSADIWVTNTGDNLAMTSFDGEALRHRIARLHGVSATRPYRGGFLDYLGRRVWIIARSPMPNMFPASQLVDGDEAVAQRRLGEGGWVTISRQIASAAHVGVGGEVTLPTPTGPVTYRVAATTTNLGWSSGAIVMASSDYARAWQSNQLSAIEVNTVAHADTTAVRHSIQALIGGGSGLTVQTSGEREAAADLLAREGLSRLSDISLLLTVAAALAMAAAMGAAIWQRRPALASLRIQSYRPSQLRGVLLCEAGMVFGTGCLVGASAGVYGHIMMDRYLQITTGFPALTTVGFPMAAQTLILVTAFALAALLIPGYLASQAPPGLALRE